jgi:class 3 adenylate cyclase
MAVFIGDNKNTSAVKAALKINHAVSQIIQPAIKAKHADTNFELKHVVGIDTSALRAVRIGVQRANDLVWVGRAANHAAKLCADGKRPIWVTQAVYDKMAPSVKTYESKSMWEWWARPGMPDQKIYSSTWHFPIGFEGRA